jgi:DNA-binding MarR family transcriptional regulator
VNVVSRTGAVASAEGGRVPSEVSETGEVAAEAGGEVASEEEFLVSFEALAQAVRRARGAAPSDRPGRLTLSQYSLVLPLAGAETARVSDLATEAGIAPSTATRILDALERRAIVRRTRSLEDRRGVMVTLTDAGRRTLCDQDEWMRERKLTFFAGLPAGERELVSDLLVRLAALIDDLSAGPDD